MRAKKQRLPRKEQRSFLLVDEQCGPIETIFRSARPRGAALKAAGRGHEQIGLFDPIEPCIWRFRGWQEDPPPGTCSGRFTLQFGVPPPKRPAVEALGREAVSSAQAERLTEVLVRLDAARIAERNKKQAESAENA